MVWLEPWQAARAILERSSRNIAVHPTKNITEGEAMEHEEVAEEPAVSIPTPPGVWRLGLECPHAKALVMRFATRTDRKIKGAERMSHYYRNHGNPNYGGMAGLISSSRKRRFHGKPDPADPVDSKNPWGSLAESWGASEPAEVCGNYMETTASEPAENWEERLEGTSAHQKQKIKSSALYCITVILISNRKTLHWNWIAFRSGTTFGSPTTPSISITIKRHRIRSF